MFEHYAEDYSLIMGIVDLVPVVLFGLAGAMLIKILFNELKKPFAVLLCSGVTLSLTAGIFKAIWKILLSLNICDFYPFDIMFMPTQSLGFILMGIGLLSILFTSKVKETKVMSLSIFALPFIVYAEPVKQFNGSAMFIAMLVIGELMICTSLSYLAVKNKNWLCLVLFIISCICLIMMGAMKPLSTKMNLDVTTANWIEEGINVVAQSTLLIGVYLMNKKGFFSYKQEA